MSASFDYSYLDMNIAQRAYADSEPTRGVSWDDSSLYYQTLNEWDYPIPHTYKSQNPSPKHSVSFNVTSNRYQQEDSETEDMDTTSASSIDENLFNQKQGSRDSMEDIIDTIDSDDEYVDQDSTLQLGISQKYVSDNKEDNNEDENIHNAVNSKIYSFNDKDMKLIIMESKVSDLNHKIETLMGVIKRLKRTNLHLVKSKLDLINNTANAMNGCRDAIKKLSQQNRMLLKKVDVKRQKKQTKKLVV